MLIRKAQPGDMYIGSWHGQKIYGNADLAKEIYKIWTRLEKPTQMNIVALFL